MAEETQGATGATEPAQLSSEGSQIAAIIQQAQNDPVYAALPEVKALLDQVKNLKPTAPAAGQPAQPANPAQPGDQMSAEGAAIAQILALAATDPVYAALPEVKAIVDQAKAAAEAKKNETPADEEGGAEEEPADEEGAEEDAEKNKGKNKSVFYSPKSKIPELKTPEEHQKFITEKFGVKDPVELYKAAEGWRKDSQDLKEAAEQNSGYKKLFDEIPDVVYDAIQAWGKGQDWMEVLKTKTPAFDFSKPFESQTEKVLNQYFPGKFTAQEIQDNSDQIVKSAIEVAKSKFDLEKNGLEGQRAKSLEAAENKTKALKTSVDGSVDVLKQSFPDFNPRQLADIRQMLLSGDVTPVFFKKDGTYKPEAAKMLAMAVYGEQEITGKLNSEKRKAATKASNKVLMNLIERGKTTVTSPNSGESREQVPAEVSSLLSGVNKKSTY